MEIKQFVENIGNCEKSTDLCQFLGSLYGNYLTAMCRRDAVDLDEIHSVCRVLHKHARKEIPEKAFICGMYAAKFERLKEDIIDRQCEEKRIEALKDTESRRLFKFLFENGCCQLDDIKNEFSGKEQDIIEILEKLVSVDLAYCVELPTVAYCELTSTGYMYFNKTIGMWGN